MYLTASKIPLMHKGRLEAFSDAVIAIALTIMVLELKAPLGSGFQDLAKVAPELSMYVLSFVFLGIYWNNHHHILQRAHSVNGGVLWANQTLLFWLSLVPFVTQWMGQHPGDVAPVASYGTVLLCSALSFTWLTSTLVRANGKDSEFAKALGSDFKGKISLAIYIVGIAAAFIYPYAAYFFFGTVALIWLIPDRRFEKDLTQK